MLGLRDALMHLDERLGGDEELFGWRQGQLEVCVGGG